MKREQCDRKEIKEKGSRVKKICKEGKNKVGTVVVLKLSQF